MLWVALLLLAWCITFFLVWLSDSFYIKVFVVCQFLFVAVGLIYFYTMGPEYAAEIFNKFHVHRISNESYLAALGLVTLGCFITVLFYMICGSRLSGAVVLRRGVFRSTVPHGNKKSIISMLDFFLLMLILLVSVVYIAENYTSFSMLILTSGNEGLGDFVDYRRDATRGYLLTLFVYNVLPAYTIASLASGYVNDFTKLKKIGWVMFVVTSVTLLLTFQKRPLLIFFILSALTVYLCGRANDDGFRVSLLKSMIDGWKLLFFVFIFLGLMYYFYTSFRFEGSTFSAISSVIEVSWTRLIGRLSLPAAMYVETFPDLIPHYGLSNVGMITAVTGEELFQDSSAVFKIFSSGVAHGAVAASLFIDAYGQGGGLVVVVYALITVILVVLAESVTAYEKRVEGRIFLIISFVLFFYYLSQASLFRSLFGYGLFFYLAVYYYCFGARKV